MFESVLIANRGEIAVRIAKTLRKMGIRSVVVASIPDRRSLAVRTADAWVLLEGYSAAESYLAIDAVIAAAKAEGCQAIHPGYGFLSERADFAERCAAEGITFIGPPPEVLRGMGDKVAARQLAIANGVPVVPGWDGDDDPETLVREAARIGYPVMLKARGGGGGRGMREVFAAEELPEAIESARREALAAFGDGGLLLEKLVTNAHHVEVQVLADTHGNVIHLGERDCSVQRRHQKLIEESPSPVVDDALRERLTGYALKLARAISYVNAGTFEFLVELAPLSRDEGVGRGAGGEGRSSAEVYFLEVNPRLQVEHPVTEMVTGLDLVELQLRIAAGEPLPLKQEDVTFTGHAIEFRINAEDPWDNFKPSSGRMDQLVNMVGLGREPEHFREEAGYRFGDSIPSQYDSLIEKRIVHGPNRESAIKQAELFFVDTRVVGVATNERLLRRIVLHSDFAAAKADVGWLERTMDELLAMQVVPDSVWAAGAVGFLVAEFETIPSTREGSFARVAEWHGAGRASLWLCVDGERSAAEVMTVSPGTFRALVDSRPVDCRFMSMRRSGSQLIEINGEVFELGRPYGAIDEVTVTRGHSLDLGTEVELSDDDDWNGYITVSALPPPPLPRRAHAATAGATAITAPLSGTIAAVRVAEGDEVAEGQLLLVLEAMKMEHRITAPAAGTVKALPVKERDTVREGDVLAELA